MLKAYFKVQHKCEHDLQDTNSFSQCCEHCLNDKLMFFMGSLREACQAAFSPTLIEEVCLNKFFLSLYKIHKYYALWPSETPPC